MLSEWLRGHTRGVVELFASALHKLGLTPNALTVLGGILMLGVGLTLAQGKLLEGALLLALVSAFDALDGGLARLTNRVTTFGAFLDSSTDRWAEAAVYGGLIWWYTGQGLQVEVLLAYIALVGSLMVSYTRARAEGMGVECKVGLFTRFERIAVLLVGLLTGWMVPTLIILAVFTNITALQRVLHVQQQTK